MRIHNLKIWPDYYHLISGGYKTFELRKNDRDFRTGDILHLEYYNPDKESYHVDKSILAEVIGVLTDVPEFGLMDGYALMSIKVLKVT